MVEIKKGQVFYYDGRYTVREIITMSDTNDKIVTVYENWNLYSLEIFEEIMNKQDYYKARYESNQAYKKEQNEKIAIEEKLYQEIEARNNDLYGLEKTFSTKRNIDKAKNKRTTDALNGGIKYEGKIMTKKEMVLRVHEKYDKIVSVDKKEVKLETDDESLDCVIVDFDLKCQVDLLLYLRR